MRETSLLERDGSVSIQAFDAAEARYKKAAAMEISARHGVEKAQAALRLAELNLEYSYIRAPFDGVILTATLTREKLWPRMEHL